MTINAYQGIADGVSSITPLRGAAGLYIPNYNFRDRNLNLYYDTSYDGEDGNTWSQYGFRNWFAPASYNTYTFPYGTDGLHKATGYWDPFSIYAQTTGTGTSQTIETNNRLMAATLFCGHIPFNVSNRGFTSHWLKPITAAFTLMLQKSSGSGLVWGTDIQCFLACYNSQHEFCASGVDWNPGTEPYAVNPVELEWTEDGNAVTTSTWQVQLAHSTQNQAMCAATRYVQLYVGFRSSDGVNTGLTLSMASLMLNPCNSDAVTAASPEYFVDMDSVYLASPPSTSYGSPGTMDLVMADGRINRIQSMKGGPRERADLAWYSEDGDFKQKLVALWNLSNIGMGPPVPQPVPLCLDVGMGQLPTWGYYHMNGDLSAPFNPYWTVNNQGYDLGCNIMAVG